MKGVSILGSTGSIGVQTLEVISQFPEKFKVLGLSAGRNVELLAEQIKKYRPKIVSIQNADDAMRLKSLTARYGVDVLHSEDGAISVAKADGTDIVVSAMVGASGLRPTIEAIRAGKDVALANKEVLVIAGSIVTNETIERGVKLIPIDSEHSAIFQVIRLGKRDTVRRVILTASGGPFRNKDKAEMQGVTVEEALAHPTWKMGAKITIDSATMMNKGFEMIEARWLFSLSPEEIDVWIHPQSIVHSMVEYIDGSYIAQLGLPDMKIPIAYALSYPERFDLKRPAMTPADFSNLTFEEPDYDKYPALRLARTAMKEAGTMPAVLNAANEVAVDAFLNRRISFIRIPEVVERVMDKHDVKHGNELEDILECDLWARRESKQLICEEFN